MGARARVCCGLKRDDAKSRLILPPVSTPRKENADSVTNKVTLTKEGGSSVLCRAGGRGMLDGD